MNLNSVCRFKKTGPGHRVTERPAKDSNRAQNQIRFLKIFSFDTTVTQLKGKLWQQLENDLVNGKYR